MKCVPPEPQVHFTDTRSEVGLGEDVFVAMTSVSLVVRLESLKAIPDQFLPIRLLCHVPHEDLRLLLHFVPVETSQSTLEQLPGVVGEHEGFVAIDGLIIGFILTTVIVDAEVDVF